MGFSIPAKVSELRRAGKYQEACALLLDLYGKNPNDSILTLHCATIYDNLGLEAEAIPFYERAIELGLPSKDLQHAILGLGSSYRCLKLYEKSLVVLEDGVKCFPDNWSIKIFLAMTYHELGY